MKQRKRTLPYILLTLLAAFFMGGTAVLALTEKASGGEGAGAVSQHTNNTPKAPQTCPATLRIMPVGDSITEGINSTGAGTAGAGGGYREPLFASLTTSGYTFDFVGSQTEPDIPGFDNDHEGYPGDATDAFINRIYFRLKATPADVVLIHLGTNDIPDTDPTTDLGPMLDKIDQYESEESAHVTVILAQIINRPCDFTGGTCDTKFSQTSTLNNNIFDLVQARITAGDDIRLINMENAIGFDYSAASTDFTFPADDKHPSNAGYIKMATAWDAELDAYISSGCAPVSPATPPTITTTAGLTATAGLVYTYDVDATGDPTITYSLTTAPTGMTIDSNSGLISWTPTNGQAGANSVTVQASNGGGSDTESFTVTVDAPPVITSSPATSGMVGTEYSTQVQATGYPTVTFGLTSNPSGMIIDTDSGIVTWTPASNQTGSQNVTVEATNSGGSDSQSFTITVTGPPTITSSPATNALVGTEYSYQVQATGVPSPTYSFMSGPSGMSMDANGLVTWTPTGGQVGDHDVTVKATNSDGTDTQDFTITVSSAPAAPTITSSPSTSSTPGATYSYQVQATGFPQATFSLTVKPTGMNIDSSSGLITWTPGVDDAGNSVPVTVTATNSEGSDSQSFSIDINYVVYLPLVINQ